MRLLNGESREGASPAAFVKAATGVAVAADADTAADALSAWAKDAQRPGLLPLLLVDECDALVRRFDYRFFERLRGMLDDLCLGVSSRRELDRVFLDAGKGTSPFQNRLELHWVGLLEPDAAEQLIATAGGALSAQARREDSRVGRASSFLHPAHGAQTDGRARIRPDRRGGPRGVPDRGVGPLAQSWSTLGEPERQALREAAAMPKPQARRLRQRGLLDEEGRPFGRVLTEWLADEVV